MDPVKQRGPDPLERAAAALQRAREAEWAERSAARISQVGLEQRLQAPPPPPGLPPSAVRVIGAVLVAVITAFVKWAQNAWNHGAK
jgi:hypothetical protein